MPEITINISQETWDVLFNLSGDAEQKDGKYHTVAEMAAKVLNETLTPQQN